MSVNKVILIGHVGKDPEVKYGPSGTAVCRFSVATNETFKDKTGEQQKRTEWHSVVCFGKLAEVCGEYLAKSKQVYIEGTIRSHKWEDRDGHERKAYDIVAHWMQMLSPATNGDGAKSKTESAKPAPQAGASQAAAQPSEEDNPFEADESVPF
jgi:single-strand DNA-binding protein